VGLEEKTEHEKQRCEQNNRTHKSDGCSTFSLKISREIDIVIMYRNYYGTKFEVHAQADLFAGFPLPA
jgi:hypothetical protein